MPRDDTKFSYSAAPQAVRLPKKKYRDDDGNMTSSTSTLDNRKNPLTSSSQVVMNIMTDPRVARGNTNPASRKDFHPSKNTFSSSSSSTATRRLLSSPETTTNNNNGQNRPYYEFRYNYSDGESFDLSPYLVENVHATKVESSDENCQTDEFIPRPITPRYIPRKTGKDISTQVDDVTELFDFDKEVAPIVSVLVSKTLEQALFEVECEEELIVLEETQQHYHQMNQNHLQWIKQEEDKTKQEIIEKNEIVKNSEKKLNELMRVRNLVAGQQFMQQMLPDALQGVYDSLYSSGVWKDKEREICETDVLPELCQRVESNYRSRQQAIAILDEILNFAGNTFENRPMAVAEPIPSIVMIIQIVLESSSDNSNAKSSDDGESEVKSAEVLTLGPWMIDQQSTVSNIYARIKKSIRDKEVKSAEEVTQSRILSFFSGIAGRQIATDACLTNFELPSDILLSL